MLPVLFAMLRRPQGGSAQAWHIPSADLWDPVLEELISKINLDVAAPVYEAYTLDSAHFSTLLS